MPVTPHDEAADLLTRARAIFDKLGQEWLGARTLVGSALACLERLRPKPDPITITPGGQETT